ncbi:MAG: TolC family protein [Pseudomonadota bacterium]
MAGSSAGWAASLNDELVFLLTQHPRIKAAQRDALGAQEGVRGAIAGYYPQLSVDANYGDEYSDTPSLRLQASHPTRLWRDTRGITMSQSIFDGFRREANVEGARINRVLSGLALETTRQSLSFEGARTYVDVLRYARLVELAFNNESTVQRQLNLEDERVQRGAGISVDVLQAKARLQTAKERRVQFEGQLRESVARYMQLFGHEPQPGIMEDPVLPRQRVAEDQGRGDQARAERQPADRIQRPPGRLPGDPARRCRRRLFPAHRHHRPRVAGGQYRRRGRKPRPVVDPGAGPLAALQRFPDPGGGRRGELSGGVGSRQFARGDT